jgi:hypothetical protein
LLEHDPKKGIPVLGKDHAQNNNLERDVNSNKDHLALGKPEDLPRLGDRGDLAAELLHDVHALLDEL